MSKTDRKKKLAAKRAGAEAERRAGTLVKTPRRKASGRRAEPKGGWGVHGPTPENQARRDALLAQGAGCVEDWIDVAKSAGVLDRRIAEAIRLYRAVVRAFARHVSAPALSAMTDTRGAAGADDDGEAEFRRLRSALEDAAQAMRPAGARSVAALDAAVRGAAMPTAAQMAMVRHSGEWLVEWAGV